jgi:hypothetical protein
MLGFTKIATYLNLYYLYDKSDLLVLVLYVDDLILTSSYEKLIAWCKKKLASEYDMKDIGLYALHFGSRGLAGCK